MPKKNKRRKNAEPTRFEKLKIKYSLQVSSFKHRFPKWKYIALGVVAALILAIILMVVFWPSNEATTARTGDTVKVTYIGTYDNGSTFDSANSSAPIEFVIGNSSMIPGFEKGVIGLSVNQTKKIRVAPEDGYGPSEFIEDLSAFADNANVEVGQFYNKILENGMYVEARVKAVNGSTVTMENLAQLAGQYLNFEITLVELRKQVSSTTGT